MPVLLIDDSVRGEIKKVIDYAKEHPSTKEDLANIMIGKQQAVGYDTKHYLVISGHYRVVYSQEIQLDDNTYHHLSVSVPDRDTGKCPSRQAVEMIMEEFGMGNDVMKCEAKWLEDNAVNLIKKI